MNKVFNSFYPAIPSKYIDGCETICVVRENEKSEFYHVAFNPMFENNGHEEYYYAYVFEDMYDLINYFADNAKSEKYIKPKFCDAFKTKKEYCRWFDNLQYNQIAEKYLTHIISTL